MSPPGSLDSGKYSSYHTISLYFNYCTTLMAYLIQKSTLYTALLYSVNESVKSKDFVQKHLT